MVGLVLVSHSRMLADAVCRLAGEVAGGNSIPIAFAAGAGSEGEELGTDATAIMDAIRSVDRGDGVIVLMDLGSAVLSSRMAVEMLAGDVPYIRLCPAPLVEGAVAMAVRIAAGAEIGEVFAEAGSVLAAKVMEVGGGEEAAMPDIVASEPSASVPGDALQYCFIVDDPNGVHARPAARLAAALAGLTAEVRIRNQTARTPYVNARSLNQIALSNIRRGDVAELAAWGPQAEEVLTAVKVVVSGELRGREAVRGAESEPKSAAPGRVPLATLSPGLAEGLLHVYGEIPVLQAKSVADPGAEAERFDAAIDGVREETLFRKDALDSASRQYKGILEAQLLLLEDDDVLRDVRRSILLTSRDAASSYQVRMTALADSYRAVKGNPYLRERAADVEGVAAAVLSRLLNRPRVYASMPGDVIVWGREISPARVGEWAPGRLKGILAAEGGDASHVAILARELGIPAITGYVLPECAASGDKILLDADRCEVAVNPCPETAERFRVRRRQWEEAVARDRADGQGPAVSLDGVRVSVFANVGGGAAAGEAAENGADGIGLLRTEFLFLDRMSSPSEDEQAEQMAEIMRPFAGKPVVVRTLDAGGDKPMPWLDRPAEANPFLGVRGIRISVCRPEIFKTQIRAILRAGIGCDLAIMIPMVDTAAEVAFFHRAIEECHGELADSGIAHAWPVKRGIMVETPAAALQAPLLSSMVDFFSVGSNDLTQYVMCVDRGAGELAHLSDGMQPPVLRMIGMVCAAAGISGREVAVCGEMAADPVAVRALLGLGVGHVSVNGRAVGGIKRVVRECNVADLRLLSREAIVMDSAEKARLRFSF